MPPGNQPAPLRLGVLGCADIATRRILPAVTTLPQVVLTAVGSRTPDRARAVASRFGAQRALGYDELLADPETEAVYIPLPPALRAARVRDALAAGKHVLAEKPLTTSRAESAELTALAARSGLVLMENYMFVHHSQHHRVRTMVEDGAIGRLQVMHASFTIPPRPAGDIRYRQDLGGGALLDCGGYPVRAALFFLGEQLSVRGASLRRHPRHGVDVAGDALLRRADGTTAHVSFGMEHAYSANYQLHGSTGKITVDHAFSTPAQHRPVIRVERQDGTESLTLAADDQCANTLLRFARAVRAGDTGQSATSVVQAGLIDSIRALASVGVQTVVPGGPGEGGACHVPHRTANCMYSANSGLGHPSNRPL